jgi:hypothetical protein
MFSMRRLKEFVDLAKKFRLSGFVVKEEGGDGLLSAVADVIQHHTHFPC